MTPIAANQDVITDKCDKPGLAQVIITVENTDSRAVVNQPVRIGIPLPRGSVFSTGELGLFGNDGEATTLPASIRELTHWPDGSLNWVLLDCQASCPASSQTTVFLKEIPSQAKEAESSLKAVAPITSRQAAGIAVTETDASITLNTGVMKLDFARNTQHIFPDVQIKSSQVLEAAQVQLECLGVDNAMLHFRRTGGVERGLSRLLTESVSLAGEVSNQHGSVLFNVTLQFTCWMNCGTLGVEMIVHNPRAALHPGGLWDLGDPGSSLFRQCALRISLAGREEVSWRSSDAQCWQAIASQPLRIEQYSSGGDAWQSPNHLDAEARSLPSCRGYRVYTPGDVVEQGDRASPSVRIVSEADSESGTSSEHSVLDIHIEQFWQNFPKAIDVDTAAGQILVALFPDGKGIVHELQGGEKKTHRLQFAFGDELSSGISQRALRVTLSKNTYSSAQAMPWLDSQGVATDERYDALIHQSISGQHNFIAKREHIDEYGWRNFGDLYADHETWNYEGDDLFVSHYNNQYDPVYGFARQFALTGDTAWFELMQDLARHIIDIDMYDTTSDRAEYNGGLFWHTDHYLKAGTATHRTYSRDHDGALGGGPGGQHCYTTGLRYYYLMTGDEQARKTVFQLTDWIAHYYDGTNTVIEWARRCISEELPSMVRLLRGQPSSSYRYPLDRGTGNYIVALLDSFELSGDREYLHRAECVIQKTIGPDDDMALRALDDIEKTWFYTIFLQALVRYLDVKYRQEEQNSEPFHYARQSLLHYAEWMSQHETPYLHRANKLDYVNDTWAAQDARKISVLQGASRYADSEQSQHFQKRAKEFRDYVVDALEASDTAYYTRIQAILLQNHGASAACLNSAESSGMMFEAAASRQLENNAGFATVRSQLIGLIADFGQALRSFSPAREWRWISHRLPRRG
ncbi:MAG: hypothetical protein V3U76_07460 [Granulosicoccus sp.]